MRRLTLCMATALVIGTALWAGKQVELRCGNPKCGFHEEVTFGGGFRFAQVTGWCTKCQKFVYLTWDRDPKAQGGGPSAGPPPKLAGSIWLPATGKTVDLYACPDCKNPFLPIDGPEDFKFCPKCGKPGFGYDPKKVIMFD
jgi:hypothetical protein